MTKLHQSLQQQYTNKKILILGFGREGQSSYEVLRECFPDKELFVGDQEEIDLSEFGDNKVFLEKNYLAHLDQYDVIFKTPGISQHIPQLQQFLQQGKTLTSELNEFLKVYRSQTVGITGTKGKSTTSSLIVHMLKTAHVDAILAGNIGLPVFKAIAQIHKNTTVVVEMSSYQLETISTSPHIAALLDIFPEHLNYHGSFTSYIEAKFMINAFQTTSDMFIYNQNLQSLIENNHISLHGQTKPFSSERAEFSTSHLPKVIEKENVAPAVMVCKEFGLTQEAITQALATFKPLPHRLENVGSHHGVTFIDDTLATIPEATIAALDSLEKVDVLILGGNGRFGDSCQRVINKRDRKSTRLNSSHQIISYAVFCLKKNKIAKQKWHFQPPRNGSPIFSTQDAIFHFQDRA